MKRYFVFFALFLNLALSAYDVRCGGGWWRQYQQDFGTERTSIRFPAYPTITQGNTMITATAYDRSTCYTFTGYYPPMNQVDPHALFTEMLGNISLYPYSVVNHSIHQDSESNWVLEYTAQDSYRNYLIRSFTVVTKFNSYTLQCVHPIGAFERFDFFRDSFHIYSECDS